jgi:hypothetical protein
VTGRSSKAAVRRLVLTAPLLCLVALSGCKGKTYTCSLFTTFGGQKILVKTVEVKSQKECAALADG